MTVFQRTTALSFLLLALGVGLTACGDIQVPATTQVNGAQQAGGTTTAPKPTGQTELQPKAAASACGTVQHEGCCESPKRAIYCTEEGTVESEDCGLKGKVCGWDPVNVYYGCVAKPATDPTGQFPYACDAR
ncbi:MAG: hypothetical protein R3F39_20490 [Myxococcota bacterium]